SRRILIQRTSFTVEQLKTCGGDAAADSIPWPNGTSECSAGASPSQGTGCACADQPLGASPRLAKPDASAFRLILIPRTSFTVETLKTPRVACFGIHCGSRKWICDDLHVLCLDSQLLLEPPLELWPTVVRRQQLPADVERVLATPFA